MGKLLLLYAFPALILTSCSRQLTEKAPEIDDLLAWAIVKKLVSFGQRPAGSEANLKQARFIMEKAKEFGADTSLQSFKAETPLGKLSMANVRADIKGKTDDFIIIGSHFDTKRLDNPGNFQGANDGASSTAVLLAMIKAIKDSGKRPPVTLEFVFFDGEECVYQYGKNDGLHGSSVYAESLEKEGRISKCKAVIVLDMIGDKDLNVTIPADSSKTLVSLLMKAAEKSGTKNFFKLSGLSILDDHVPFRKKNIPCIDIIDFEYGPDNLYWHTHEDNLSNISPQSLKKVGNTTLEMIWNIPENL